MAESIAGLTKGTAPANRSRRRFGRFVRPGQSLVDVVERLGGQIHYQELDDWIDEGGSILVHGAHDFDILLPLYTSPLRDQFTIGHELGHYFLHSKQGQRPLIAHRHAAASDRSEWEANWL